MKLDGIFGFGLIVIVSAGLAGACSDSGSAGASGGANTGGQNAGGTSAGGSGTGGASTGGASTGGSNTGGAGTGGSANSGGTGGSATDGGVDANPDADSGSCLTDSIVLAFVPPGGGSACSFTFDGNYTPGEINLVLTPGWGTVCYAGSSGGCGSGSSSDGWWWIGGNEIALCDSTCTRFYDQPAGKLTIQLGCATKNCF